MPVLLAASVKARVRASTETAIAHGVFGVPTIIVDGELFWGQDALAHIDAFVRGADPAAGVADPWRGLTASATRPGTR